MDQTQQNAVKAKALRGELARSPRDVGQHGPGIPQRIARRRTLT